MQYIHRQAENNVLNALRDFPVVALTGPRQCGKSTMAKHILDKFPQSIYLDMERPSDLNKLQDAEWFLSSQKDKLVCIDEIQRRPDLFPLIRSLVDEKEASGRFLILGSASRDLLQQSSESLAGRIHYEKMTPFLWNEIIEKVSLDNYFNRGGFPRSLLYGEEAVSFRWREDFIATFLERDLIQWRNFTPATMRRLWQMLAHVNGQTADYSTLANSLGVTSVTVKNYIDLLESTYMIDVVRPYFSNAGKRLVKAPKIYISDSGITSALLGLYNKEEMMGHPSFGSVWEQMVLLNLKGNFPGAEIYFYRTSNGAEMDFVMKIRNKVFAIECKTGANPHLSKGNYNAREDINPDRMFVAMPVEKGWPLKENIDAVSLSELKINVSES